MYSLPTGDRGAVEHLAFRESFLLDDADVECDVLPLAARVGEAKIRIFDVVVLDQFQDILGGGHRINSPSSGVPHNGEPCPVSLNRIQTGFTGSDANGFLYLGDENLSIANAAGLCSAPYGVDRLVDHIVAQHDLDLHLRQKIDHVFRAAIQLRVSLLASEPLRLRDRNALKSNFLQSLLYFIELKRLDDRLDLFHCRSSLVRANHTGISWHSSQQVRPRHVLAGSVPTARKAENTIISSRLARFCRNLRGTPGAALINLCAQWLINVQAYSGCRGLMPDMMMD